MPYYAGIGSRETPEQKLELMEQAAVALRQRGWTLRSGHAPGADQAFERGAAQGAEIYLPWATFESATPTVADYVQRQASDAAFELAAQHHPGWEYLKRGGRALHARNCHQVLGRDLSSPSSFVLCFTKDGSLDGTGRGVGGTGQALRLAVSRGIPVFNLALPEHEARVRAMLAT